LRYTTNSIYIMVVFVKQVRMIVTIIFSSVSQSSQRVIASQPSLLFPVIIPRLLVFFVLFLSQFRDRALYGPSIDRLQMRHQFGLLDCRHSYLIDNVPTTPA